MTKLMLLLTGRAPREAAPLICEMCGSIFTDGHDCYEDVETVPAVVGQR